MRTFPASSLTFVSAFADVYGSAEGTAGRPLTWRIARFREIAETGVQICLFSDVICAPVAAALAAEFPAVCLMAGLKTCLETFESDTGFEEEPPRLPSYRSPEKDTRAYITLMHAKVGLVARAMAVDPFGSSHFAWIDFNASHVFRNLRGSQERLRDLAVRKLPVSLLAFPGCTSPAAADEDLFDRVCWRFCGGFFLGDRASLERTHALHVRYLPDFLVERRTLAWEVNFWAWMEARAPVPEDGPRWAPHWFAADHDDSIIALPDEIGALRLRDLEIASAELQIAVPGFSPGSAAVLRTRAGQRVLNTRFVDYRLASNGGYIFSNAEGRAQTRNFVCELDPHSLSPGPIYEMHGPDGAELATGATLFRGLEDLRLYAYAGRARFIATSVEHSRTGGNVMVVGDYNTAALCLSGCARVEPPAPSGCEKNWAPVPAPTGEAGEWFVYRWGPLEIGRVDESAGRLRIERSFAVADPLFQRFRGSSALLPLGEGLLVGVVHFSEEGAPRRYFHALVALNARSLEPSARSEVFFFDAVGVEFCTGFEVREAEGGCEYSFWISRADRDPLRIDVAAASIPLRAL